jgi:two-component system, OmpR family, sensor histidine kinase VanS
MKTSISKRLFSTIFVIVLGISTLILLANSLLLKPLYYSSIKNTMLRAMETLSKIDYSTDWSTFAEEINAQTAGSSYDVIVRSDDQVLYSDSKEFGLLRQEQTDGSDDATEPEETDTASDEGTSGQDRPWRDGSDGSGFGENQSDMGGMLGDPQTDNQDWEQVDENTSIGIITEPKTEIEMYICTRKIDSGVTVILSQAIEPINQSIRQSNILLIACAVITLGLSAIVVSKLSRRFTEPIRQIKGKVGDIAALQFGEPCSIKTGDELQSLGSDVNLLGDKLKSALDTLRLQNEQLEKDIAVQRRFISNASHELRTPLSLIKGYSDEMEAGFAKDAAQKDLYISIIAEEAGKMNRLLKEMLELSRMESGSVALQNETISVKERIQIFLEKYDGYITENGLEISLKFDCDDMGIFDPMYFEQVLANYISNASRYGDEKKNVEISTEGHADSIRISVFNTGEPISNEILPHIWDGFYKADNARTRVSDSYGLGLSIVKAIQNATGQNCGAENVPGGVIFWFDVRRAGTNQSV